MKSTCGSKEFECANRFCMRQENWVRQWISSAARDVGALVDLDAVLGFGYARRFGCAGRSWWDLIVARSLGAAENIGTAANKYHEAKNISGGNHYLRPPIEY
jgi:hypothetical protein